MTLGDPNGDAHHGKIRRLLPHDDDYTRLRMAKAACMRHCDYCARFGVTTQMRHGAPVHVSKRGLVLCDALRADYFLFLRLTRILEQEHRADDA